MAHFHSPTGFAELASSFSTAPATSRHVPFELFKSPTKWFKKTYIFVHFRVMVFVVQVRGMLMKAYKTVIKKEKF